MSFHSREYCIQKLCHLRHQPFQIIFYIFPLLKQQSKCPKFWFLLSKYCLFFFFCQVFCFFTSPESLAPPYQIISIADISIKNSCLSYGTVSHLGHSAFSNSSAVHILPYCLNIILNTNMMPLPSHICSKPYNDSPLFCSQKSKCILFYISKFHFLKALNVQLCFNHTQPRYSIVPCICTFCSLCLEVLSFFSSTSHYRHIFLLEALWDPPSRDNYLTSTLPSAYLYMNV